MLTQKRFEELVAFAQEGNKELMEAIRMAEYETFQENIKYTGKLLRIIADCAKFFNENPNPESAELLKRCKEEFDALERKANPLDVPNTNENSEEFIL